MLTNIRIRAWLSYFTLFLISLVGLVNFATLIYHLLEGSYTTPFLLKVLILFIVCGLVFYYYKTDLQNNWPGNKLRYFSSIVSLLIISLIGLGFYTIGSPTTARQLAFDGKRTTDLSVIQLQIFNYWRDHKSLPNSLQQMATFNPPLDPETSQPYIYKRTSPTTFELCANFSLSTVGQDPFFAKPGNTNFNWVHPAGNYCFPRTVSGQPQWAATR